MRARELREEGERERERESESGIESWRWCEDKRGRVRQAMKAKDKERRESARDGHDRG